MQAQANAAVTIETVYDFPLGEQLGLEISVSYPELVICFSADKVIAESRFDYRTGPNRRGFVKTEAENTDESEIEYVCNPLR